MIAEMAIDNRVKSLSSDNLNGTYVRIKDDCLLISISVLSYGSADFFVGIFLSRITFY